MDFLNSSPWDELKTFMFGLAVAVLFVAFFNDPSSDSSPALIAHGCPDAGGDLFAMNEDDFPYGCESIERNQ